MPWAVDCLQQPCRTNWAVVAAAAVVSAATLVNFVAQVLGLAVDLPLLLLLLRGWLDVEMSSCSPSRPTWPAAFSAS